MAKKARRTRKTKLSQTQLVRPSQDVAESAPAVEAKPTKLAAPQAPSGAAPDFGQEYEYVIGDLKRIGILAAGMLAGLVILAFFI